MVEPLFNLVTARNISCGKVMLSQVSSVNGGICLGGSTSRAGGVCIQGGLQTERRRGFASGG